MSGAAEARPFTSVIVPFWGGEIEGLRSCLLAIASQNYPRERYEVIVVDNHREPLPMVARSLPPGCILLHQPKPGSYSARNLGLSVAKGDIIAFTDADCLPVPGWLGAGVRALEDDPDLGFVGGHIELTVRGREPNSCEIHELCLALNQARHITDGFAATANLFARRSLFVQVGFFDDAVYSGGDKTWGLRASGLGHRCTYSPEATVLHPARATLGAILRRARRLTAQNPARQRKRGRTRFRRALLVADDEFKTAMSRFIEIGKRWRRFRLLPTGGALIVAGLVSLTRAAELMRLALGGTPQR